MLFELLLTWNVLSQILLCHCHLSNNVAKYELFMCYIPLAQMTSFSVLYNVIYHSFPINSRYLMMWGVDSPVERATIYSDNNKKKHQIQPSFIKRVTIHKILMATLFLMGNKARKRKKYFHMTCMHAINKIL